MTFELGRREGPMAWTRSTTLNDDGLVRLNGACQQELLAAGRELEANPLPTEALHADEFVMPATVALMHQVRTELDDGLGFAIIDHVPVDELTKRTATQLYWLMMDMLGRPVAQKWDGTMVYDVTDTGQQPAPGNGVRSSKSNRGQGYHTDNAFNTPPDYVALFCLRPAKEGGLSGLLSMDAVYNTLLERSPDSVARLFNPFLFDRQREHAPDDDLTNSRPMFENDHGTLKVCLSTDLVRQGHAMTDTPLDPATDDALSALDEAMEDPALGKSFDFEAGQIQILNNRRIGHRRTGFVDSPEPDKKRHLVRLWMRERGKRSYHG